MAIGRAPRREIGVSGAILDGALWPAGIAAGVVFGAPLIPQPRMGEPVTAHVTANLLLSLAALPGGQW